MPESRPKRRWYQVTPDRLIFGLLAVEVFLVLSERFQWFAFNEKKGWTVLIAVAAVCLAVVVMLLWLAASLLLRWRFQFSLRSLVLLVVAVGIPCSWLGVKMRESERQRQAVEAIQEAGGLVTYDFHYSIGSGYFVGEQEPPAPTWLRELVGNDFLSEVHVVSLADCEKVDNVLERLRRLRKLWAVELTRTQVTDAGLEHLKGLTELDELDLARTPVTYGGIEELRKALPNYCHIRGVNWSPP